MSNVCVRGFSISLDGYGAGPQQSEEDPVGVGGRQLHRWMLETRTFRRRLGTEGGSTGLDDAVVRSHFEGFGATIMGRNMFSPLRGPWEDESWRGWWGEEPPWGYPVFVLTHHARPSLEMQGGTTFHFVTGGVEEALARAREAAGERDVLVSGGAATIRQLLEVRAIDELDLAVVPVLLGEGERLWDGLSAEATASYRLDELRSSDAVSHVRMRRVES
jgi:dihydrofolate reductase